MPCYKASVTLSACTSRRASGAATCPPPVRNSYGGYGGLRVGHCVSWSSDEDGISEQVGSSGNGENSKLGIYVCAVALVVIVGVCVVLLVLRVLARQLVGWSARPRFSHVRFDGSTVSLPSNSLTRSRGVYGLRAERGHARVGEVLSDDGCTVVRTIQAATGHLHVTDRAVFTPHIHSSPAEIGAYEEVDIPTQTGVCPAWIFGEVGSTMWVVHVHGLDTDRSNALRSVAVLKRLMRAQHLAVSYRGDGDGPCTPGKTTRLGLDEWHDVDDAIAYAVACGAEEVLLVGWCLGATIALLVGAESSHRALITGQILIAPPTDWDAVMITSAERRGIPFPKALTRLVTTMIASPAWCRLAGLVEPIDLDALNWASKRTTQVSTLVIHSAGDRVSPLESSRRFAQSSAGHVEIHETLPAAHTREYNVDEIAFERAIETWLQSGPTSAVSRDQ